MEIDRNERDLGDPARLLTELASDGLDISSIISQPRSTAAAAIGNASESAVIDWDQDVGVLMEEESEAEALSDVDTTSEINSESDVALESEVQENSELPQETETSSFDVGDLFEDDEGGEQ